MKIAVTVAEYNPFHVGHAYNLAKIRGTLKPDALCVFMCGDFTRRGEAAVADKFARARHAVEGGADVVFELPAAFSVAQTPAFCKGAVKLASALDGETTLCFGAQISDKKILTDAASVLCEESKQFRVLVREELSKGLSDERARFEALAKMPTCEKCNPAIFSENVVALEFASAVCLGGGKIDVLPLVRDALSPPCDALSIRELLSEKKLRKVKKWLPEFVIRDLPDELPCADKLVLYSLASRGKRELRALDGCDDGLENRIKALLKDNFDFNALLDKLATRALGKNRLLRMAASCLLGVFSADTERYLKNDLYLRPLAVKSGFTDTVKKICRYPLILGEKDAKALSGAAAECYEKDEFASGIYNIVRANKRKEFPRVLCDG